MKNNDFQSVQDVGFSNLISKFKSYTGNKREDVITGIGDDASVIKVNENEQVCTTSEIFVEGVHFDLTYTPFHHLGYKLVTAAVSDVYAMNARPEQLLVNIAIPNKYSVQMIESLYKGIDAACKDYNVQLTGGDTTASHQLLAVSVTSTGKAKEGSIVTRKQAKEDDIICVTGDMGAAMAGLRILLREKDSWKKSGEQHFQPDLEKYEYVVQRQLVPKARFDLIKGFENAELLPTSMIDLTQGLVNDLQHLGRQSDKGIEIYAPAVPISFEVRNVADEMQEDVDKYAFYGGEDFEMLFTLTEENVEKLKADFEDFSVIGKITEKEEQLKINTGEDKVITVDLFKT